MVRLALVVALLFAIVAFPFRAFAEIAVVGPSHFIGEDLEAWEDTSGRATADDAMRSGAFARSTRVRPNIGYSSSAYFYRFTLFNPSPAKQELVLDAAREWVSEVDLHRIEGDRAVLEAKAGALVPRAERTLPVPRPGFPIDLEPGARRTYVLRLAGAAPISLFGEVTPRKEFLEAEGRATLVWGAFFGVLLGLALYSAIVFGTLRDPQWRLGPGLLGLALLEAFAHGHVGRLLPFVVPHLELRGCAFGMAVFTWYLAGWARVVLHSSERPRIDALLRITATIAAIGCALGAVILPLNALTFIVPAPLALSMLGVGIVLVRDGHPRARPYSIALGAFLIPGCLSLATILGLFPLHAVTEHSNHVGAVIMAALLALVASSEMRATRTDLASAHGALEKQMKDLEEKNREVTSLAEDLREQVVQRSRELSRVLEAHGAADANASPVRLADGAVFDGRYRVVRRLGAGGMGDVYEVVRERDGRRLALKVLSTAPTPKAALRLTREAEVGARLRHPNLVSIVDVGLRDGMTPFLVMELVDGGSLEDHRDRFGDVTWALAVLRGIAAGLCALHDGSVIHRDLKPSNVLLDHDVARICDFGIAKPADLADTPTPASEADAVDPTGATVESVRRPLKLTATGAIVGTPLYMAPEALVRGAIGPEADVFAFGLIAYELLTKEFPLALFAPSEAPAEIPLPALSNDLATALRACLSPRPSERPRAPDLRKLLEEAVQGRDETYERTPPFELQE